MPILSLAAATIYYTEYGNPAGDPLFFFHGWPGSNRQAEVLHAAAMRHGFRLIAPDRPGIGGSPMQHGRRVSDWPPLIAEMADSLGIGRFAVMGVSGGGPYALACAAMLPERVRAAAIVCGAPEIAALEHHGLLNPTYRALLWLFHRRPGLVLTLFRMARPLFLWRDAYTFLPSTRIFLPGPDAETLDTPEHFESVFGCNRDAFRDVAGLFHDASLYTHPWEFDLARITAPTHIWHGTEDANFHWSLATTLASRLPASSLHLVKNEGHFSLPIRQAEAIVSTIRGALG